MNDETKELPSDSTDRIVACCDAFEDNWSAGSRPRIESYLEMVDASLQPQLLRALLRVELKLLHRSGATTHEEDYQRRFPELIGIIDDVFREQQRRDASPMLLGNYQLLEKVGEGGMGAVYKARHTSLNKIVAVKLLPHDFLKNKQAIGRFRREMQAVGKLDHPNIVRAMDAGEIDGLPYLVMEFAEGLDLRQLVSQRGPLGVEQAVELVIQAARALDYAHCRGLIHRDIKPSNLLFCPNRTDEKSDDNGVLSDELVGQIKVLDLGLARAEDDSEDTESLTSPGTIMGTVDYMSLEQAEDMRNADARSDIYSLGCTLFFLLTGRPPYKADTHTLRILAHRERPTPSLSDVLTQQFEGGTSRNPDQTIPLEQSQSFSASRLDLSALDRIFCKMVAKRSEDRFASMADVIWALTELQSSLRSRARGLQRSPFHEPAAGGVSSESRRAAFLGLGLFAVVAAFWLLSGSPHLLTGENGEIKPVQQFQSVSTANSLRDRSAIAMNAVAPSLAGMDSPTRPGPERRETGRNGESANPDRRAAEWILRSGGTVKLKFADDSVSRVSDVKELPSREFAVYEIDAAGNPKMSDADAARNLRGLSGLVSLQVHHTGIGDATLEVLHDSPALVNLHLERTSVTDAGLKLMGRLPKLKYLVLNQTIVTADCLSALMAQPDLIGLDIGSIPISESAAKVLLAKSRWRKLALDESWIQPDRILSLVEQDDLNHLKIYGDLPASRLSLLAALPHLKSLEFSGHRTWSTELSVGLSALPQLDSLLLVGVEPSVGWNELIAARPWRELTFANTHLSDEAFDAFDHCVSVKAITLTQTTSTRSRLQRFQSEHPDVRVVSERLRRRDHELAERLLRMGGIDLHVADNRGTHFVHRLEDLPDTEFWLNAVYVNDCPTFNDRNLAEVAGPDLHGLSLLKSGVTPAGMIALDQFTMLHHFWIGQEIVSPETLQIIARQPYLEAISLQMCSAEHLAALAPLRLKQFGFDEVPLDTGHDVVQRIADQFPELAYLACGRLVLDEKMAQTLLRLPRLQFLLGQARMLSPEVVTAISRHPALSTLQLFGEHSQPWPELASLHRITTVLIGINQMTDIHIERLAELPQLQHLTFDRCSFSAEAISASSKLHHVAKVEFKSCEIDVADRIRIRQSLSSSKLIWNGTPVRSHSAAE